MSTHTRRARRTRAQIDALKQGMLDIAKGGSGMTIRHLFYRMVSAGLIEKTEHEYENVVVRLALELRRDRQIPYGKIIDGSRMYTVPSTYSSPEHAIRSVANHYRRNYWNHSDCAVEVWCEKNAIRGIIQPITRELAVPLMVTSGFASESVVQQLAEEVEQDGRPRIILSLNDYDPSGALMLDDIIARARHYAPYAQFVATQVALTEEQVGEYDLPTRPTKREGNTHALSFDDERSVELDAMAPMDLRGLLRQAIEEYMDQDELDVLKIAEASEKQTLMELAQP